MKNNVTVTGGKLMFAGVIGKDSGQVFDIEKLEISLRPGHTLTFTSQSGSSGAMSAAVIWQEDF
jgi:hypothetical protein